MPQRADTTLKYKFFPTIKTVTHTGVDTISDDDLAAWYTEAQPNEE